MDCAIFQLVNLLYVFALLIQITLIFLFNLIFFHRRFILKDTLTLASYMTETNLNLERSDFDGNNSEQKSWTCVGQSCSRSLIVFLSQFFTILLIILSSFWRIQLATSCEETTVWVGILCSAAGNIVPTPRL